METEFKHIPIMLSEVTSGLNIRPDGIYLDCTIGGGGHSSEILNHLTTGKLIGIDKDQDAIEACKKRFAGKDNVILYKGDFKQIDLILNELNINSLDGVLLDLGVSSHQIDTALRGFSFRFDAPLDMRMDRSQNFSALDVVNKYSFSRLMRVISEYGEEPYARSIAFNIIKNRPVTTTKQLASIIENSMPKKVVFSRRGAHKKTFQAIRIEVNGELDRLFESILYLITKLNKGGRMAVLTFHSLEDRIVKNAFKLCATECICPPGTPICVCGHKKSIKLINKKPIIASKDEQKQNPRSTSAKLRIIEKI